MVNVNLMQVPTIIVHEVSKKIYEPPSRNCIMVVPSPWRKAHSSKLDAEKKGRSLQNQGQGLPRMGQEKKCLG